MASCMSAAPVSPSPLTTHFSSLLSPLTSGFSPHHTPSSHLCREPSSPRCWPPGTSRVGGRPSKPQAHPAGGGDIAVSDTWVPSGPGAWESRDCRGPRDWGLCSRDANLHPQVEKSQGLASYGPMRKGRVRGSVCVPCLTGVRGSQTGPARGKASRMWVLVQVGLSSIPVPRGYRAVC